MNLTVVIALINSYDDSTNWHFSKFIKVDTHTYVPRYIYIIHDNRVRYLYKLYFSKKIPKYMTWWQELMGLPKIRTTRLYMRCFYAYREWSMDRRSRSTISKRKPHPFYQSYLLGLRDRGVSTISIEAARATTMMTGFVIVSSDSESKSKSQRESARAIL